jgi:hypothetical protein
VVEQYHAAGNGALTHRADAARGRQILARSAADPVVRGLTRREYSCELPARVGAADLRGPRMCSRLAPWPHLGVQSGLADLICGALLYNWASSALARSVPILPSVAGLGA